MIKRFLILILLFGIFMTTSITKTYASYEPTLAFGNYNYFSTHWGLRVYNHPLPDGTYTLAIVIPASDFHVYEKGGIVSTIKLTDGTTTVTINFSDLGYIAGDHHIVFSEYTDISVNAIHVDIMQSWESVMGGYLDYINANTLIGYNGTVKTVKYMSGTELYYQEKFVNIPRNISYGIVAGFTFVGWADHTGNLFDFTVVSDNDVGEDKIFYLYARFTPIVDDISITPVTPSISPFDTVLGYIGFNNITGKLIIYVAVMLLVTIGLLIMKLDGFIIVIANGIVLGLFIFLGWIPIYVMIILGTVFVTGFIKTINGGFSNG